MILLPACTIAGDHTITAGYTVKGLGRNTILSGTIDNDGILQDVLLSVKPS